LVSEANSGILLHRQGNRERRHWRHRGLLPGITEDVEIIPIPAIHEALERMLRQDVKYRFATDMKTLQAMR